MKNVSKLALFVAAGMVSAGANAATIEIPDGTSMGLEGEVKSEYIVNDTVDSSATGKNNRDDLAGEITLGLSAVRSFENFDGYVDVTFKFNNQEAGGSSLESDGAAVGLKGDFGQIEAGDSDSVYEDQIHDSVDIFEQAGLSYGGYADDADGDNMLTYYSPDMNGFSLNLQVAIQDEAEGTNDESDQAFIGSAEYDFGPGAFLVGYDDLGFNTDSSDELLGLAVVFDLGAAEVSLVHEMETINNADTDYTGLTVALNYGPGDVYGAYQSVSPDAGEDLSQYAVGINAEIADGLSTYAEYGNLDGQEATDKDTVIAIGLIYGF